MTRMTPVVRSIVGAVILMASIAAANAQSLNGQNVTVTLSETGYSDVSDTVTAGPGGPQIVGNTNTTNLGSQVLQSGESVDLQNLDITAVVKGDGGPYLGSDPGCSGGCSVWDVVSSDATYQFSGLNFGSPGTILTGVVLSTSNIFGAYITDVTANSFDVVFGAAGIPNGSGGNQAFGTLNMALETSTAVVPPVPEPSTYVLMLAGLLVLIVRSRFRFRSSNL
jgi:PEP-CTERM motif-containing protein